MSVRPIQSYKTSKERWTILPLLSAFAFGFGAIASKRSEDGGARAGARADVILASMMSWLHPKSPVSRHVNHGLTWRGNGRNQRRTDSLALRDPRVGLRWHQTRGQSCPRSATICANEQKLSWIAVQMDTDSIQPQRTQRGAAAFRVYRRPLARDSSEFAVSIRLADADLEIGAPRHPRQGCCPFAPSWNSRLRRRAST